MPQLYNAILAFLSLYISLVQAVQPLIVEGSDFVNSVTKDRFQIIGVAYDRLTHPLLWKPTDFLIIAINQAVLPASILV